MIRGIGISVVKPTDEFIRKVKMFKNAVLHMIFGVHSQNDFELLSDNDLKLLILEYKGCGRGMKFMYTEKEQLIINSSWIRNHIMNLQSKFAVISFDNLAVSQLGMKSKVSSDAWEKYFLGEDGKFTFYIDCVSNTFSKNSTIHSEQAFSIDSKTVIEMFQFIRNKE